MKKKHLISNLADFNYYIKEYFEDSDPELGEKILNVNGATYRKLRELNTDKEEIVNHMIVENSKIMSLSSELQVAIVNYCIYMCDVLEK